MTQTYFFDGGARPNPGPIETAVVVRGRVTFRDDHGTGSNDAAEWLALLDAVATARADGASDIVLRGDSALIVNQANGVATCRSAVLQPYLDVFNLQKSTFSRIRIRRIKRTQNLAGIALDGRRR